MEFDKDALTELQACYDLAVVAEQETFDFRGEELLTEYAKYLIEYLEGKL